ncbi:MAG: ferredoxin [Chloroflexota bacterium]|nr:MAG: ferredoxin [Chloroflexota bacterium]
MDFSFPSTRRGRRVLICVRGQCAESNRGKRLEQRLVELITQQGLDNPDHPQHVSCTITNCLGICADGPIMIVHPEAIKYHHLTEPALERIFQQHLLGNQPVEELIVREQPSRPILSKKFGKTR